MYLKKSLIINYKMSTTEEPVATTTEKFDLLIKDFNTLMDTTKSLSARMKVLQKEVSKSSRSKRSRKSPDADPDAPKRPSALQKPVAISNELCKFLGFEPDTEHSRQEVTATINAFIKDNNLQNPENRRFILLEGSDAATCLKALLRDPDQPVTFFNIQRYLKPHYPMSEKEKKALTDQVEAPVKTSVVPDADTVEAPAKTDVVPDADTVEDTPKEPIRPPAKKRVVRNPKSA
jgi:chromatin remodeling complex protein RSC6